MPLSHSFIPFFCSSIHYSVNPNRSILDLLHLPCYLLLKIDQVSLLIEAYYNLHYFAFFFFIWFSSNLPFLFQNLYPFLQRISYFICLNIWNIPNTQVSLKFSTSLAYNSPIVDLPAVFFLWTSLWILQFHFVDHPWGYISGLLRVPRI